MTNGFLRPWAAAAAALALVGCAKAVSHAPVVDTNDIAATVKHDAELMVRDFNTKDGVAFASHDARNVVAMFHGVPNSVGASVDLAGTIVGFNAGPLRLELSDMTVDVPASGDYAVLRAAYRYHHYDPDTNRLIYEKGNYLAGYRPQTDGVWRIEWNVFSDTASGFTPPP